MTVAQVFVHSPYWPYSRIAELRTAHSIDRSFERMGPGQASIKVSHGDSAISPDVMKRGNLLVITSTVAPPWVGPMTVLNDTMEDGEIAIEAMGWTAALEVRGAPLAETWSQAASGAIFRAVIARMNNRGHTGLFATATPDPGPAVTDFAVGGQTAREALDALFTRTGYEWWAEYDVSPARIIATMYWGARQGFDRYATVTLQEGVHFVRRTYTLDVSKIRQSVTVVGGGFGTIANRTAVTRTAAPSAGGADLGSSIETIDRQLIEALDVPPLLRSESVLISTSSRDYQTIAREAQQALEQPAGAAEKFVATVNTRVDWSKLGVGNYHRVITAERGLGSIDRRVRVIGMQPDEEIGECDLVLEVPVR